MSAGYSVAHGVVQGVDGVACQLGAALLLRDCTFLERDMLHRSKICQVFFVYFRCHPRWVSILYNFEIPGCFM